MSVWDIINTHKGVIIKRGLIALAATVGYTIASKAMFGKATDDDFDDDAFANGEDDSDGTENG